MSDTSSSYNPFTYQFSFSQFGTIISIPSYPIALSVIRDKSVFLPNKVLLIKRIPYNTTEMDLINLCKPFGTLEDICIIKDKGYAFVQFKVLSYRIFSYL